MSLTTTYRPLYAELGNEELAKVGEFASAFLVAHGQSDKSGQRELVKTAMLQLAEDDVALSNFIGALGYAEEYGSVEEQNAVAAILPLVKSAMLEIDQEFKKTARLDSYQKTQLGVGLSGLALSAAPFAAHMMHKAHQRGKLKHSLQTILHEHPELRDSPHTARYFQAVADFAPDVASNSLVAGNVLKTMHQIGPGAVTPRMLSELLSVQKDYQATKEVPGLKDLGASASKFKMPEPKEPKPTNY